jgi:hypothetical protein
MVIALKHQTRLLSEFHRSDYENDTIHNHTSLEKQDQRFILRSCAPHTKYGELLNCVQRKGLATELLNDYGVNEKYVLRDGLNETEKYDVEMCTCRGDGCNMSGALKASSILALVSFTLSRFCVSFLVM